MAVVARGKPGKRDSVDSVDDWPVRATDLQDLVDSLADRLERPVAVDDRQLRLLAYSSHGGPVDPIRTASILTRQVPKEAVAIVHASGVADSAGPVRLAARRDLQMDARVIVAARYEGMLLGYIVLLDPLERLSESDLDVVSAAADVAGALLYREQLLHELDRGRERELLRDLLSPDPLVRSNAATQLVQDELFKDRVPVVVLVAKPTLTGGGALTEAARIALGGAVDRLRPHLSARQRLHLVRPDHCLLVCSPTDPSLPSGGVEALAREMHDAVAAALPGPRDGWRVAVGIGEEQAALEDVGASYRQALQAARVAEIVGSFGDVIAWSHLGIYRLLSHFPVDQLAREALPEGLVTLFATDSGSLVETLECYLDLGCDAQRAASVLSLHRASLYYRLHKVEEITGFNLRDGEDRLALHLGLKLARLAGLHPMGDRPAMR